MTRAEVIRTLHDAGCNGAEITEALALREIPLASNEPVENDVEAYVAASMRAEILSIVPDGQALSALYGRRLSAGDA